MEAQIWEIILKIWNIFERGRNGRHFSKIKQHHHIRSSLNHFWMQTFIELYKIFYGMKYNNIFQKLKFEKIGIKIIT
jgi:hypothetical protein